MGYDYQLVGGAVLILLSLVAIANAMVENRSPLYSVIGVLIGAGLVGWAWMLSGQELTVMEVPNAVFRVLATWM